jgi:hypothetical protein
MFLPISSRLFVNLHPDPNGFRYEGGLETVDVGLDQIERIEAYTRVGVPDDLFCMDIWLDRTARSPGPVSINEQMQGFDAVVEGLEELRGFDPLWRDKVRLSRVAENRTVVYERG